VGLDPATVNSISKLLQSLAEKSAPRLVLSLRPQDKLPDWISHLLVLGNGHQVLFQGNRSEAEKVFNVWKHLAKPEGRKPKFLSQEDKGIYENAERAIENGVMDRKLLWDLRLAEEKPPPFEILPTMDGEPIIEMDGVQVRYGDKTVLGGWQQAVNGEMKEGLHWKVRRGQRWAIIGANGSGKTTLLSLITSDHPQAYALPIRLFGRSRLPEPGKPAISIFDLQSRIGHSSPEVHAFFPRQLTVRQALESAWAQTFLSKPLLDYERDLDVDRVLLMFKSELDPNFTAGTGTSSREKQKPANEPEQFDLLSPLLAASGRQPRGPGPVLPDDEVGYADSLRFSSLSVAQQRLVLFLRAVIHKPDLIILDEAFSGMSPSLRAKCFHFLEAGDMSEQKRRPGKRRTDPGDFWMYESDKRQKGRFPGLTDNQALIVVSHVKEEVPDCVRQWMRLPSDDGAGQTLDFKLGILGSKDTLNSETWDRVWSSNEMMKARRRPRDKTEEESDGDEVIYSYDQA
jgi:ABC-type molybdenum transport system ATPase subunit/photorepair protein PhrA